jgi:phospholipase C
MGFRTNWRLKPLAKRRRDNSPNPVANHDNPYVPLNSAAIGGLFDLFQCDRDHGAGHEDTRGSFPESLADE